MNTPPISTRALATGMTGSGKTYWTKKLLSERHPRSLVLDFLGRDWNDWPGAVHVQSIAALKEILRECSSRSAWRVVYAAQVDSTDTLAFIHWLAPENLKPSYVRAVGGMAVTSDEYDFVAPINGADPKALAMHQRGRHDGLSIYAATQRLPLVHRVVSAQSRLFLLCAQREPRDLDSLARYLPPDVMEEASRLEPHWCLVWDQDAGVGDLLRPDGSMAKQWRKRSEKKPRGGVLR